MRCQTSNAVVPEQAEIWMKLNIEKENNRSHESSLHSKCCATDLIDWFDLDIDGSV